jgi:hypothetical protein
MIEKLKAAFVAQGLKEEQAAIYASNISITDESKINETVTNFMKVIGSVADSRVNDGVQSAITNYEKKHNLKDGKIIDKQDTTPPNPPTPPTGGMTEDMKAYFEKQNEQMQFLQDNLKKLSGENVVKTKKEELNRLLDEHKIPEFSRPLFTVNENSDIAQLESTVKTFAEGLNGQLAEQTNQSKQTTYSNPVFNPNKDGKYSNMIKTIKEL